MEDFAHDSQLAKGVLGLVLLRLIADEEAYGYDLVQKVHAAGLVGIADGSVYPAVNRLEREGWVESRLVPSPNGPARKYYRITSEGRTALEVKTRAWRALAQSVDALMLDPAKTGRRASS
jgi:PadR family transcriptional regulator PadR